MASVNKAIILGHAGRDPEVRHRDSGDAVANVSIATSETWKDKAGEKQERTEWHRVVFFGKLAEIAGEYVSKGKQVYVEGRITTRKYTDKDGVEKYSTEIIGDKLVLLGGGSRDEGERPARTSKPAGKPQQRELGESKPDKDFDDDIPF